MVQKVGKKPESVKEDEQRKQRTFLRYKESMCVLSKLEVTKQRKRHKRIGNEVFLIITWHCVI